MLFQMKYKPVIEDFGRNGKMIPTTFLKIMENAGSCHSDYAKDGILAGCLNGHGWVLTDWRVEILKYPEYGKDIRAQTWTEAGKVIFGTTRNLLLFEEDDETNTPLVRASSKWARIDLNTGRPVKIEQELMDRYVPDEKKVFEDSKMPRIAEAENWTAEKPIPLRRSDIEFNNQLHNLSYLDFAMEMLPENVYNKGCFKNIRISYKSAVKEGETIVAKYAASENGNLVGIYGSDGSLKTIIELGGVVES